MTKFDDARDAYVVAQRTHDELIGALIDARVDATRAIDAQIAQYNAQYNARVNAIFASTYDDNETNAS